ncbi:hypothetical protein [Salinicola lusitanus]|uniref:TFIIB-type domain-containing protein n=1 Tax=Salinicola lusitanus TaxID=1949085 RepID=A0ABZ3CNQ6_9GAMM|nr:hypothetical protein [Salinicola lusitanus]
MKHEISCPRCGHHEAASNDTARDWDEIKCLECGEFLGTCDHQFAFASRNHRMHTLSQSLELLIELSRDQAWTRAVASAA